MWFMKELNCHGFDLIITLKSIKSLEFYGPRFSYFNTLEVAFEYMKNLDDFAGKRLT